MVVLALMDHAVVFQILLVKITLKNSFSSMVYHHNLGRLCESSIDPCASNPCQHNGLCFLTSTGYQCQCSSYYTGAFCEITQNPCDYSPCRNGGQCRLLGNNSFYCACSAGILI